MSEGRGMSRGPGKDILSACPFCGGWAQVDHDPNEYSNRDQPARGFFVECGICSASTAVYRLPSEAVAAWNRRAAPFSAAAIRRLDSVRTSVCFKPAKTSTKREPTGDPIDVPVERRSSPTDWELNDAVRREREP
jgi:hypothetical protein